MRSIRMSSWNMFRSRLWTRRKLTTNNNKNNNNNNYHHPQLLSSTLPKAESLHQHYSQLQTLFDQLKNQNGVLPLLNNKQQEEMITRTKKLVIHHPTTPTKQRQAAAVLVLVCSIQNQPSILFTKRAAHLSSHAAEMAFVGGHYDPIVDLSLIHTALREAQEELLPNPILFHPSFLSYIQIVGICTPLPSLYGTPVTPVIAVLWPDLTQPLTDYFPCDPSEVDTVLAVSIHELMQKETTKVLPANQFRLIHAPVYPTPHGDIWGLTAYILRPLLHQLFQRVFLQNVQVSNTNEEL